MKRRRSPRGHYYDTLGDHFYNRHCPPRPLLMPNRDGVLEWQSWPPIEVDGSTIWPKHWGIGGDK